MPSKLQCSPSKLDRVERSRVLKQQLIDYNSFLQIYTFYSFHILCCIQLILKTRQGGARRDFSSSEQIGALIKAPFFLIYECAGYYIKLQVLARQLQSSRQPFSSLQCINVLLI